jgi:type IV pilus assembly protein PilY1
VLGDIVSSEGRYVKQPQFTYSDPGYSDFKTAKASRAATVYVGSNDGMLHAFDALTGRENWAFIPSAVLPEIYRLADSDYANKHRYFVDGTPEVGDICPTAPTTPCGGTTWKTILVGGLNQGGKSFYALDITDPAAPALLWEFDNSASKANGTLGYSFSNPRITKLDDGTWVVVVASGYNNTDGVGRLYVINAGDGSLIRTISTGVGTAANPSGLAKLTARASTSTSGGSATKAIYGGDLLGNMWRFDVNNSIGATGFDAQLMVSLVDSGGTAQPITAKPIAASVGGTPMVMIGTGRYMGLTDLPNTSTQSMYAFKDLYDAVTLPSPRTSGSHFVAQTLTETTCPTDAPSTICSPGSTVRTVTSNAVDWGVDNGWYLDFLTGGERSVTDPALALGTLAFTTIKPQTTTTGSVAGCTSDDTSVNAVSSLYYLDYRSGGSVSGTKGVAGENLCTCVATRPSVVKTQSGAVRAIIRTSGTGRSGSSGGSGGSGGGGGVRGDGGAGPGNSAETDNDKSNGVTLGGSDQGDTTGRDLPILNGGTIARRLSWRELNGE